MRRSFGEGGGEAPSPTPPFVGGYPSNTPAGRDVNSEMFSTSRHVDKEGGFRTAMICGISNGKTSTRKK